MAREKLRDDLEPILEGPRCPTERQCYYHYGFRKQDLYILLKWHFTCPLTYLYRGELKLRY